MTDTLPGTSVPVPTPEEVRSLLEQPVFVKHLERFFFGAHMAGYFADDGHPVTYREEYEAVRIPSGTPGGTRLRVEKGFYLMVDEWVTTPLSDQSFGTTVISYADCPVWRMQYAGMYPASALPCLKNALRFAYRTHEFHGGRGPRTYDDDLFCYENHPSFCPGFFAPFEGREMIYSHEGREVGYHNYSGGPVLELPLRA